MHPAKLVNLLVLGLLVLLLAACEGYSQVGARSSSHEDMNGGTVKVKVSKASGTTTEEIEVGAGYPGKMLETSATLTVEKGSFKIELLGEGDEVTLVLEARDGESVSGHGQMVVDTFGEAGYRVTAVEAGNVDYSMIYTFR